MRRWSSPFIAVLVLFSALCLPAGCEEAAKTDIKSENAKAQEIKAQNPSGQKNSAKTTETTASDDKKDEKAPKSHTTDKTAVKTEKNTPAGKTENTLEPEIKAASQPQKQETDKKDTEIKEISFSVPAPERETSILNHRNAIKYANEKLAASAKKLTEMQWYPAFHAAPPANLMSSPNGLAYFNNKYHLFYQHNPFSTDSGRLYWGHAVSEDMVHWENYPVALAPTDNYDKDGVYPGSAIEKDGLIYLLYSGNYDRNSRKAQMVNLAMSKDGINFVKSANNPVLLNPPAIRGLDVSKELFRDPFVWKHENSYYALIGTQNIPTKDGMVLIYESNDLTNWKFKGITAIGHKGEIGYMWDAPGLVNIEGMDVLLISPQGIKPSGKNFLNKNQSGWFVGNIDYTTGKFKQTGGFGLFDRGFDFYSPQVMKNKDGRVVIIGRLGMDESSNPEKVEGWSGMMSIPREIKIVNKKVVTRPVEEMKNLRGQTISIKDKTIEGEKSFLQINGDAYELELEADLKDAKRFSLALRNSETQKTVLTYDREKSALLLNRDKSGADLSGEREASLALDNNILKLRIFVDKSSVEIFAGSGEVVMSSRIYPDKNSTGIKFISDGKTVIKNLNFYKLKSIHTK